MASRRFDLFIVDANGTISHKSGNGDQWLDKWTPLPGSTRFKYDPVAIAYPVFRLNVFAVGTNNQLFYRWREGPTSNWQPEETWQSLGGACTSKPLAIVSRDMLHVFVLGINHELLVKRWNGTYWSSFENLGVTLAHMHLPTAHTYPGGICLYSTGTDRNIYHKWGEKRRWYPEGSWYKMTGVSSFAPNSTRWDDDGRLVVHVGTDSALWQKWVSGGGWEPSGDGAWSRIEGDSYQGTPEVVVRNPENNRIAIFAVCKDGSVVHMEGVVPTYSSPVNLGGNADNFDIVAISSSDDRMDLFIVQKDGKVYHKKWNSGQWEPSQTAYFDLGGFSHSGVAVAQTRNPWSEDENITRVIPPIPILPEPVRLGTYFIQSVSHPGNYLAYQRNGTITLQQSSFPSGNRSLMWTISSGKDSDYIYIITPADNSNAVLHIDDSNQAICSATTHKNITWNIDIRQPDAYVIGTGAFALDLVGGNQVVASIRTPHRVEQRWRISKCNTVL